MLNLYLLAHTVKYHRLVAKKIESKSTSLNSITSAPISLSADQGKRQRKYVLSMSIRTICFILSIFLPSPYRWFTMVGAVTLPYISVVIANAGRETINRKAITLNAKEIE